MRVLEEVELVVLLGVIPLSSLCNLRHNRLALGRKVLLLDLLRDTFCDAQLLGTVRKDGRPVFCTHARIRKCE